MEYEHLKRERAVYNDRTEIMPNAIYLRGSVAQHGADEVQTSTNDERSLICQAEA